MRTVSAREALDLVPEGAHLASAPGCGAPTTLLAALPEACAGRSWELGSGILMGDPGFAEALSRGDLAYRTWHVPPGLRKVLDPRAYVPLRASRVAAALERWGLGAAIVRVSPPGRDGTVSLGGSVGYGLDALRLATIRIAEVDSAVPRTQGDSTVPVSLFDALVDSDTPMPTYAPSVPDETSRVIARHVLGLLPRDPVLQIGIGAVPESVLAGLADADLGHVRFEGMGSDAMVDLFEQGVLDAAEPGVVRGPELMGSARIMSFADGNRAVEVHPSSSSHDTVRLGALERLVSVNAAIEVDLAGNVNVETVRGRPVAGIGGALDFVEAARRSPGGARIVSLTSASPDGTATRIVPSVATVSIPGPSVDVVVTEHGAARLEGLTVHERAQALIAIAHPAHRNGLEEASG